MREKHQLLPGQVLFCNSRDIQKFVVFMKIHSQLKFHQAILAERHMIASGCILARRAVNVNLFAQETCVWEARGAISLFFVDATEKRLDVNT